MLGPSSSPRDSQTSTGDRRDCVDCSHGIGGTATPLTSSGPCKRELYRWPPGFASSLKRATETQRDSSVKGTQMIASAPLPSWMISACDEDRSESSRRRARLSLERSTRGALRHGTVALLVLEAAAARARRVA